MKTYYVMVGANYVDQIAVDGYGTTVYEEDALVLYYAEAVELCHRINRNAGKIDEAVMVEAIEQDESEADDRDEHQKRADALAERADDAMDDYLASKDE